jgi:hypothetical protein
MARARSLKPGFFHDTKLTALPPRTRLLFSGLWCYADREGLMQDDTRQIKHDVLPDDRCNVDAMLNELASATPPFIIRYEVNGIRYIQIRNFKKHQNPHVKEPASTIPAPGQSGAGTGNSGSSRADSLNPLPFTLNRDSRASRAWPKFEKEFPGEVKPDWDLRIFLGLIVTEEDERLLFANLKLWKKTERWQKGYIPSAENYLRKGQWKTRPKDVVEEKIWSNEPDTLRKPGTQ